MLEVDTTAVTLGEVLKTSGHVDKFTDWMTRDTKTGDIFRADHLIEAVLEARLKGDKEARGVQQTEQPKEDEKKKKKKVKSTAVKLDDAVVQQYETILAQIDNFDGEGLADLIAKHTIKSPETQNDLTKPVEFNLMFESSIGPTGQVKGYLRPETAQGHFVNFARLLEFNNGRVPFASAQIGKSFRNEISPKQGLLRVREFLMAEIEHYVDPLKKDHPRFSEVENVELQILPKEVQVEGKTDLTTITVGEAVKKGIIDNQTLGYFVARINLFLQKIGINKDRLRFRQHMSNEMAHYASDCWDAEIHTSYGWIECVGCADRSAYDLTVHAVRTGQPLVVREPLPEIKIEEKWAPEINKKKFGPTFRANQKIVESTIFALDQPRLECIKKEFDEQGKSDVQAADGNKYELTPELLTIEKKTFKETKREFTPNVIEPSFGIGRILYALLEHSFYAREQDESRTVSTSFRITSLTDDYIRFSDSHHLSLQSRHSSYQSQTLKNLSQLLRIFHYSFVKMVLHLELMTHLQLLVRDTQEMTNLVPHTVSLSTLQLSRTKPSLFVNVTQLNKRLVPSIKLLIHSLNLVKVKLNGHKLTSQLTQVYKMLTKFIRIFLELK